MENLGNFGNLNHKLYQIKWIDNYLQYLDFRKRGLKKKAQIILNEFFNDFEKQNKSEKRKFIDATNEIAFHTDEYSYYLPTNLNQLFQKEIIDWIKDEKENSLAYKWSTSFEDQKTSLLTNPNDQITLELVGKKIINKVSINQHELAAGFGYQGDPSKDVYLISFFEEHLNNIEDLIQRKKFEKLLSELKACALREINSY